MREKPSGGFQRKKCSQPLEITTACRSDTYLSFAHKAAAALNIKPPSNSSSSLCLFKVTGGAKIVDSELIINEVRPWTLGNCLSLLKKSSANVQIGVAYTREEPLSDICFSDDSEADVS